MLLIILIFLNNCLGYEYTYKLKASNRAVYEVILNDDLKQKICISKTEEIINIVNNNNNDLKMFIEEFIKELKNQK